MIQPQNISQLTLIKTFSTSQKYIVHTQFKGKLYMYQIDVNETTTVQLFITMTLSLLKNQYGQTITSNDSNIMQLYAARKNGRKISDLPSFESQQKIIKTGQKYFYLLLSDRDDKLTSKQSTKSAKSIRTQMKPLQIKKKESIIQKQKGCFCFT